MGGLHSYEEVRQEIDRIVKACSQCPESPLFSDQALSALLREIGEYGDRLFSESIEISKRAEGDNVWEIHVIEGKRHLRHSSDHRFSRNLGMLGGVCLGSAVSTVLAMIMVSQYPVAAIIASSLLGIAGAFMTAHSPKV